MEIRDHMTFVHPEHKMKAVPPLCFDEYGSVIWDLASQILEQFFKCWNTCVKLCLNVPRNKLFAAEMVLPNHFHVCPFYWKLLQ